MHKRTVEIDASEGIEKSDLSVPMIAKGVVGFFAFAAGSGVIGWLIIIFFAWTIGFKASSPVHKVMPGESYPLLQNGVTAKTDIYNLRYKEGKALNSYGPVEGAPGANHIPIDRAMELSVEREQAAGAQK